MPRKSTLWRHRDFLKLWGGQAVSRLGSQISVLAFPLIAITVIKATTFQVALLTAVEFSPFILVGLPAGVWVDRMAKRPVLIAADIGRLVALASVPVAHELWRVTMLQLYAVAFATGVLTVFFDVAYQSYLPVLVTRDELVDGNAKLATTDSAATVAGPSVAGVLIQWIGAPLAFLADAGSFAVSAVTLLFVRRTEPAADTAAKEARRGMRAEIAEGLGYVLRHPLLRPIACCTATSNLFSSMITAVITVFMVRSLGMSAGLIGVAFGLGNVGFVVGALISRRMADRFGVGRTIVWSIGVGSAGGRLLPIATSAVAIPWIVAGQFLVSMGSPIYNINQVSLRQAITPFRLQGRMNASMRFMVWGTMPVGSVIGGVLGTVIGLRPTLVVGGVGLASAFLWVALSPVPGVTEIPDEAERGSHGEEVVHPAPGVSGVIGAMSGPGGVVDETVLGLGIPGGGDVR